MSVIFNDNIQSNSPKSLDNKYMVDGVTPYADVAEVNSTIPLSYRSKGLTVLILNQEYWYRDGVADGDLILKGGGGGYSPPIVRYVYLVQDASDAVRMGGNANNTYTTSQEAYDEANALQISLGGINQVVIKVGKTTASAVGDILLTSGWNQRVGITGISNVESAIGNIDGRNALGNGYQVASGSGVQFSNLNILNIFTNATGVIGSSGNVSLFGYNLKIGSINTSITNVLNTTGNGGFVNYFVNGNNSLVVNTIITSSKGTASLAGNIELSAPSMNILSITTADNNDGGYITINGYGNSIIQNINCINSVVANEQFFEFKGIQGNAINLNLVANTIPNNFTDITYNNFTLTNIGGGVTEFISEACNFGTDVLISSGDFTTSTNVKAVLRNCLFTYIINLGNNSKLVNCTIRENINGIGSGCLITDTVIQATNSIKSIENGITPVTVDVFNVSLLVAQDVLVTLNNLNPSTGFALPIERYVYLVNDASDAIRMGGSANNIYTTFQEAYDEANALQISLGGRVVVNVGVTTALSVGNLTLTANCNPNIIFAGINSNSSFLGNITSTTFSILLIFTNITVGVITSSDGGAIALTLKNSVSGNIVTSTTSAITTGNILIQNSYDSSIGTITATSAISNIGNITYNTCNNVTTGAISMTQTSAVASFSIGNLIMNNCNNCRFSSTLIITMAFVTSTGTIGGLEINSTNQNIIFTGVIRITAYANNTNIASDVVIVNVTCFNTTFGSGFFINNRASGVNTWEGGVINTLNIQRCFFRSRIRISYHNVTAVTTGLTFRISDCIFKGNTDGTGLDFYTQNTDVSFDLFVISNCQSNFQNGFSVAHNGFVPPTVPFTIDGVSIILNNLNIDIFYGDFQQPTLPNSVYDIIISGGVYKDFEVGLNGDMNVNLSGVEITDIYYLANNTAPSLKRSLMSGSNLVMNQGIAFGSHFYNVPFLVRNSYMGYYTNILNPQTQDIISYNSFIESFAETGSVTTWVGTFYTSTLKRLTTDSVVGVTFNNSYEEVI